MSLIKTYLHWCEEHNEEFMKLRITPPPPQQWRVIKTHPVYELSNTGVVRNIKRQTLVSIQTRVRPQCKETFVMLSNGRGGRDQLTIRRLMRENWTYEWIKELDDDEEAKPVVGHSGYFITNKGRVWSNKFYQWIKPQATTAAYYYQNVSLGGHQDTIHHLVGSHFLEGWNPSLEVCHTKEDLPFPQVHYVSNLWLGTPSENTQDKIRKGR